MDPRLGDLHGHVSQAILPLLAMALPSVISGLSSLFGKKKPKQPAQTPGNAAMDQLLQQQTQQMQQEAPLRKMLLSQSAGLLPTYMKQDPGYASWMSSSAPNAAQTAMTRFAQQQQRPPEM